MLILIHFIFCEYNKLVRIFYIDTSINLHVLSTLEKTTDTCSCMSVYFSRINDIQAQRKRQRNFAALIKIGESEEDYVHT